MLVGIRPIPRTDSGQICIGDFGLVDLAALCTKMRGVCTACSPMRTQTCAMMEAAFCDFGDIVGER